jgi:adenosine deaminase
MITSKNLVANKLCRLSSFLLNASEEFENVAKYIRDKKLKMSIRSVALTTKQYKRELSSQLSMLRLNCGLNNNDEREGQYALNKNVSDKKIVEHCCNSEVFFSRAYKSILNEYLPFKPLRDMLRYQLTGIQASFRQLKLLNSVMTPQVPAEALV